MKEFGLIHIYTGEGKGKTTAAMGLTLRAVGREASVCLVQFMKSSETGELLSLAKFPRVTISRSSEKLGFSFHLDEEGKEKLKAINNGLLTSAIKQAGKYDLLILDEVICAYTFGFLDKDLLCRFLETKPKNLEVVLTGRGAPDELIALADYVSEIRKVKHPYDRKIAARYGIEK